MTARHITHSSDTGTISYDPKYGTCWTPPMVRVEGLLTPLSGRLVRLAANYWTVTDTNGCECSFDPSGAGVEVYEL